MLSPGLQAVLFGTSFYPGATVALDFLAQRYRAPGVGNFIGDFASLPGLTVTRASVGYAATSSGSLVLFPANTARITDQGLLVEEARTNLFLQSNTLNNAAWTALQASVTSGGTTAPDGSTAWKIVEDTSTNFHGIRQAPTVVTATAYTYSIYLKAAERSWAYLELDDAASPSVYINLTTGAQGTAVAGFSSITVADAGNGWWRVSVVRTTNGTTATCYVTTATGDLGKTYTGNGTSGIYAFGAQFEAGAFATSYIPTTSASATRAADAVSIGGLSVASGSLVQEWNAPITGADQFPVLLSDGTLSNRAQFVQTSTSGVATITLVNGGSATTTSTANAVTANVTAKGALMFQNGSQRASLNGGAVVGQAAATVPTLTQMVLGGGGAATAVRQLNGYLRRAVLYPSIYSDAQLIAATS